MERTIENFNIQYQTFRDNIDVLEVKILEADEQIEKDRLTEIRNKYLTLDVKMRLAFGIREILLNNDFVNDKQDDLKLCHLLYYKLADLWFAYDSYLKFYKEVIGTDKNNVDWLDANVHDSYSSTKEIILAKNSVRQQFQELYNSEDERNNLIAYLVHCQLYASNSQRRRINQIILKLEQGNFDFQNSEILALTYAIRNNFVHNGETTVVPDNFGYYNKSRLLKVLYCYLTIVLLVSTNLTFNRI